MKGKQEQLDLYMCFHFFINIYYLPGRKQYSKLCFREAEGERVLFGLSGEEPVYRTKVCDSALVSPKSISYTIFF